MAYDVVIDESVEGKRVVNENGDEIGMVTEVREGTAYVDPDPGMVESLRSKLGWGGADEDDYPLPETSIERITDEEVRIRGDL